MQTKKTFYTPQQDIAYLIGLGWTQADIARAAGTTQPTISRAMRGCVPRDRVARKIAMQAALTRNAEPMG